MVNFGRLLVVFLLKVGGQRSRLTPVVSWCLHLWWTTFRHIFMIVQIQVNTISNNYMIARNIFV